MIELTDQQRAAVERGDTVVQDAAGNATYVLVRREVYDRLKALAYDDSPWTDDEMERLAWEAGEMLDRYQP